MMRQVLETTTKWRTIRISEDTRKQLVALGKYEDSMDSIIRALIRRPKQ